MGLKVMSRSGGQLTVALYERVVEEVGELSRIMYFVNPSSVRANCLVPNYLHRPW